MLLVIIAFSDIGYTGSVGIFFLLCFSWVSIT